MAAEQAIGRQGTPVSLDDAARFYSVQVPHPSRSNYAAMCDAAATDKHASVRCRPCSGIGARTLGRKELEDWQRQIANEKRPGRRAELREELSKRSICRSCDGVGYTSPSRIDKLPYDWFYTTLRCGRCRGCGETTRPSDATAELGDVCQRCGPATTKPVGYVIPVTVKETGSSEGRGGGARVTPDADDDWGAELMAVNAAEHVDERALEEYVRIREALDQVAEIDALAALALETWHGPDGERWARHRWGRIFALWQHTEAGKWLVADWAKESGKSNSTVGTHLRPLEALATMRNTDMVAGKAADPRRRARIGQADRQARALWARTRGVLQQVYV